MLNASLCVSSDIFILVEERITVIGKIADAAAIAADRNNKEVVFKICSPFVKCISKIKNVEVGNAEYLYIVMPMYNLLEYTKNYAKA